MPVASNICLTLLLILAAFIQADESQSFPLFIDVLPASDTTSPITIHLSPNIVYNPDRLHKITLVFCRYNIPTSTPTVTESFLQAISGFAVAPTIIAFHSAKTNLPPLPIQTDIDAVSPTFPASVSTLCKGSSPRDYTGALLTSYVQFNAVFPRVTRPILTEGAAIVTHTLTFNIPQPLLADRPNKPLILPYIEDLRTHVVKLSRPVDHYPKFFFSDYELPTASLDSLAFQYRESPIDDSAVQPTPVTPDPSSNHVNNNKTNLSTNWIVSSNLRENTTNGPFQRHQARFLDNFHLGPFPFVPKSSLSILLSLPVDGGIQFATALSPLEAKCNLMGNSGEMVPLISQLLNSGYSLVYEAELNDVILPSVITIVCQSVFIEYMDYTTFNEASPIQLGIVVTTWDDYNQKLTASAVFRSTKGKLDQVEPQRQLTVTAEWTRKFLIVFITILVVPIITILALTIASWFWKTRRKTVMREIVKQIEQEQLDRTTRLTNTRS